jgi:mono/diheme cytochrome c family protein
MKSICWTRGGIMKTIIRVLVVGILFVVVVGIVALAYVKITGLSARPTPGAVETRVAHSLRRLAVPGRLRTATNPVPATQETVAAAREHFAKYCATCHANNGSGDTDMGSGLYPKTPDMRAAETQEMSDGELFYIIEYGVRFSGMPAWGDGSPKGEELGWRLVHFIRHLPTLTPVEIAEMERLNPKSE